MALEIQGHVGCLVVNLVAGKLSSGYQRTIELWLDKSGPEWTAARLKAVWNAALHLKANCPEKAQEIYRENSIAYHKSDMTPKGYIGAVVREFQSARKPSVLRRWAAVLRFYTGIKNPVLSKDVIRDASKKIEGPLTVSEQQMKAVSELIVNTVVPTFGKEKPRLYANESDSYLGSMRGCSRYYSPHRLTKSMRAIPYGSMCLSFMTTSWIPEVLHDRTPGKRNRVGLREKDLVDDSFVGKISFLPEAGCKWRVVAQPTAWLQLAFRPLHNMLSRFTEQVFRKESCVLHQESGVDAVLNHLANGDDIFSVDMTSATDRLPRHLSLSILKAIGLEDYAEALEEVCQRPFKVRYPSGFTKGIRYTVGQPMGLYGSFPLLHLTNLVIGRFAELRMGIPKEDLGSTFKVLGDDIVFFREDVARHYTKTLHELGVETSPTKCREGQVAEFAGFVVLPSHGETEFTAFRPYKIPSEGYLTNPVDFVHALGIKVKKLSRRWERVFDAYSRSLSSCHLTLAPLIPVEDDLLAVAVPANGNWIESALNRLFCDQDFSPLSDNDYSFPPGIEQRVGPDKPLVLDKRPSVVYNKFLDPTYPSGIDGFDPKVYKSLDQLYDRSLRIPGVKVYRSIDQHPVLKSALETAPSERDLLAEEITKVESYYQSKDLLIPTKVQLQLAKSKLLLEEMDRHGVDSVDALRKVRAEIRRSPSPQRKQRGR